MTHRPPDLDRILAPIDPSEAAALERVWDAAAPGAPPGVPGADADAAWARLSERLAAPSRTPAPRPSRTQPRVPYLRRAVPAILAAVLVALGLWWTAPVEHRAAPGQRLAIELPDGSQVDLDAGSTLRYARSMGAERVVRLSGVAFFDVVHAPQPFVVETHDASVRVLGTRFGVRALPGEAGTQVALETGRVALAPHDGEAHAMQAGQARHVVDGTVLPADVAVAEAVAWRRGDVVFRDAPLATILADVERRFGVRVVLAPAALGARRISIALEAPGDAETIVRDLSTALGLSWTPTADGFRVSPSAGR